MRVLRRCFPDSRRNPSEFLLGDAEYKPFVCSEADVESTQLDGTEDFIILACDGLWDVLQPNEVFGLVYYYLADNSGEC